MSVLRRPGVAQLGEHVLTNLDKIPAGVQALTSNPGGSVDAIASHMGWKDPVANLGRGWDAMLHMSNRDKVEFWTGIVAGAVGPKLVPKVPRNPRGPVTGADLARAGAPAEEAVAAELGIPRNITSPRATIPGSGPSGVRYPDFDPRLTPGYLESVKDLARISLTGNLKNELAGAIANGRVHRIWSNAPIPSRGGIPGAIAAGDMVIQPLPAGFGMRTVWAAYPWGGASALNSAWVSGD